MKKLARTAPFVMLFSLFCAGPASSYWLGGLHAGTVCVPETNEAANIIYSGWGLENNSSATVNVHCGGGRHDATINMHRITVNVYDRTVTPNDFCCTARVLADDGTITQQSTKTCLPNWSSGIQTMSIGTVAAMGMLDLYCTIPKTDATNGHSVLASYEYYQ